MTKYPYQDIDSELLPNERWVSLTDYEGYYEVSNLGRVKSLDRTVPHPRLKTQFVKGRILKQKVNINRNTISNELMVDLQVSLSRDGKQHYRNVRRLVYSAFIGKLDFHKDGKYVINKNCDGYDNRLENVACVSVKEKSKRAFNRGRVPESYLSYADRSSWIKPGVLRRKPVIQSTLDGKEKAVFNSITEASAITGVGEKEIINVAKGRVKSWNGFVWRYAKNTSLP